MKRNNLPQYWIVKDDRSDKFYNSVIRFLNSLPKEYIFDGNSGMYYGIDGNPRNAGSDCWTVKTSFSNNPVELTLDEFIKLTQDFKFGR